MEKLVIYDDIAEECMYPLQGENATDFKKRMKKLREKRALKLTEKDKNFAKAVSKGLMPPDLEEIPEDQD